MILFYSIAFISLVMGLGAILTLIERVPLKVLYYHYHIRKPVLWTIFSGSIAWVAITGSISGNFPLWQIGPLSIITLALVLAYKAHQEVWFNAIDYPEMTEDSATITSLPILDDMEIALLDVGGDVHAYPLDFVIHHHIVNDRIGDKIISLTYCAMCRTIIPFDVTDIGPLFVGSFKNANMIVADRKTKTFFQQATFESCIGKLHPKTLTPYFFQVLPWSDVKKLTPMPKVAVVKPHDFRPFKLPMPGVWKNVMKKNLTPGLASSNIDKRFAKRLRVIGYAEDNQDMVFIKDDILNKKIVHNKESKIYLVATQDSVNGFKDDVNKKKIDLVSETTAKKGMVLVDAKSKTTWNIRGKYIKGSLKKDLNPIRISDEYWFSWARFHPDTKIQKV